jgi:hypothetical protein
MVDALKSKTMRKFMGINNVDDATRVDPVIANHEYVYPLAQAVNVDIDNTFGLASRSGYTGVFNGTDLHSLWAEKDYCLVVDGTVLYRVNTEYAAVAVQTGLTRSARMSYVLVNDRVFWTNGTEIGYVLGYQSFALADPAIEFKMPLPAGQLIEYYRGCLYVARKNILYVSDPLCDYFDARKGYKIFANGITLLRAVDDGIYVGDDKVWWLNGSSAEDFDRIEAYPYQPIIYTDARINRQHIGDGEKGSVAIWTCQNGICIGDNAGRVINSTDTRYVMSNRYVEGACLVREAGSVRHYVNSLF